MMLTATSYLLLQGPAQYFEAHHEDTAEVRTRVHEVLPCLCLLASDATCSSFVCGMLFWHLCSLALHPAFFSASAVLPF